MGTEREPVSARGMIDRQQLQQKLGELERENSRLRNTVIGLGALVADAQQQGYIAAATPRPASPAPALEQDPKS